MLEALKLKVCFVAISAAAWIVDESGYIGVLRSTTQAVLRTECHSPRFELSGICARSQRPRV